MKRRNPRFGCVGIVQQIVHSLVIEVDEDVVIRVLAKHHRPMAISVPRAIELPVAA
jgi:hypothetical protein